MIHQPSLTDVIIETESGLIPVQDLAKFLFYFRATYVEALLYAKETYVYDFSSEEDAEIFARKVAERVAKIGHPGMTRNAGAPLLEDEELYLSHICRRNPIDVVFSCVGVALTVAVIISGGEIKWDKDGFRFKLPPLGKGISEIRSAISGRPIPQIRRSPRVDPLKLDDDDDDRLTPRS